MHKRPQQYLINFFHLGARAMTQPGEHVVGGEVLSSIPNAQISSSQLPITQLQGIWSPLWPSRAIQSHAQTRAWTHFLKANLCVCIRQGAPGSAVKTDKGCAHTPDPVTSNRGLPICIDKLFIFIEKPRKSEPAGKACGGSQGQRELFVFLQFYF